MLTTKVQQDFENWMYNRYDSQIIGEYENFNISVFSVFYQSPLEMQFGIYQDYFEQKHSILIYVRPYYSIHSDPIFVPVIEVLEGSKLHIPAETEYNGARETAIKEASELAEQRL